MVNASRRWPRAALVTRRGLLQAAAAAPLVTRAPARAKDRLREGAPWVRWWWPGGDVEDATLVRALRDAADAGFGGVEIQAFHHGLSASRAGPAAWARIDDFASPRFFGHVAAAMRAAEARGMRVDLNFGSGWPFGGPAITPELAATELVMTEISVRGPTVFDAELAAPAPRPRMRTFFAREMDTPTVWPPGWEERIAARAALAAVVAARPDPAAPGRLTDARVLPRPAGRLRWEVPEGEWIVFAFHERVSDLRVVAGVGGGAQMVLDPLSRDAFDAHAAWFGDAAFRALRPFAGRVWRAVFCDSFEVEADLFWSRDLPAEFARRRGYDVLPFLPALRVPGRFDGGSGGSAPLFDMDGGALARADYWKTVGELMEERFYIPFVEWAHARGLLARVQAHGSPTDNLRVYGRADIPETETLYAGGSPAFLRQAASAAAIARRRIVSAEAMVHSGDPYALAPADMKAEIDRLTVAGVNQVVMHGMPYPYDDGSPSGWHPFMPPTGFTAFVSPRNPFWRFAPAINAYAASLAEWSRSGLPHAPIAVLQAGTGFMETGEPAGPAGAALDRAGHAWLSVDEDWVRAARLDGGWLASGGARARALMLPEDPMPGSALAEALARLSREGFPVVRDAAAIPPGIRPAMAWRGDAWFPCAERRRGAARHVFVCNAARQEAAAIFAGPAPSRTCDPWTGAPAALAALDDEVRLTLPPLGAAILTWNGRPASPARKARNVVRTLTLPGPWDVAFDTLTDSEKPFRETRSLPLGDWSDLGLGALSGEAVYRGTFDLDEPGGAARLRIAELADAAELRVNGGPARVCLLAPFACDVTGALRPGRNEIEIRVVAALSNALGRRMAARDPSFKRAIRPAGLIGPVTIEWPATA